MVGLGNPGSRYVATRHNVGFMVLDRYAAAHGLDWQHERRWDCKVAKEGSRFFMKPQSFMNLSGRPVSLLSRFYRVAPHEICVVHDDLDLPVGRLRIRPSGSAGGHNGIRSMISELGTDGFCRLKVGIGRQEKGRDAADHVLGQFDEGEREALEMALADAEAALECLLSDGVSAAMNRFNGSGSKPKFKGSSSESAPEGDSTKSLSAPEEPETK